MSDQNDLTTRAQRFLMDCWQCALEPTEHVNIRNTIATINQMEIEDAINHIE